MNGRGRKRMFVGFLRRVKKPTILAKLLALACKNIGLEIVYFTPEDVVTGKNKVYGKVFLEGVWESITTDLPSFIDVEPTLFEIEEYKKVMRYIQKNSKLSLDRPYIIPKGELQLTLVKSKKLKRFAIPTKKPLSFEDLLDYLKKEKTIVVKSACDQVEGEVYKIQNDSHNTFILKFRNKTNEISKEELKKLYIEKSFSNNYHVQKYITSQSIKGNPICCRIHLEKNEEGKWEVARKFVRVGVGQTIESDTSLGGGKSELETFLRSSHRERSKEIYQDIKELANIAPSIIENLTGTTLMNMGLDIGIDRDGKLYVFDIDSNPPFLPQMSRIILLRPGYYKYRLDKLNQDKKGLLKMQRRILELEATNRRKQKEIQDFKDSTSWKVTRPVRYLGKIKNILKK